MVTLRLDNLALGIGFIILILFNSCQSERKQKIKYQNECNNQDTINFPTDLLIIKSKELVSYKKSLEIVHIRKGAIIENLTYKFLNGENEYIKFSVPKILLKSDSIKFSFGTKYKFFFHNFRNSPKYGGKRFIGCRLMYCKVNSIDSVYIAESINF